MADKEGKPEVREDGKRNNESFNKGGKGGQRSGGRRRNNRRRGPKSRGRRYLSNDVTYECPLCGQNVRDILTAIAYGDEKIPAHFDCVVRDLAKKEELTGKEKIVYLGKGEFGVVRFKGNGNKFEIIRRLPLENEKEGVITWRKDISRQLKK